MIEKTTKNSRLNIFIVSGNTIFSHWLKSSLELTNLTINSILFTCVNSLEDNSFQSSELNVILCAQSQYAKLTQKLKQIYPHSQYNFAVMILTDSTDNSKVKVLKHATIDTIPWHNLTVFLLEHLLESLIRDYIQNQELEKLAHYDPLTNAANRRLFEDRANQSIKRAKRFKETLSLLYFDLDKFKAINDTLGHAVGDLLLIKFVSLITECCRATDIFARMGGDEFVLVLPNTSHDDLLLILDKINALLAVPYTLAKHPLVIEVSIGAVNVNEGFLSQISLKKILNSADKSVYEAKKIKGTFTHFSADYEIDNT